MKAKRGEICPQCHQIHEKCLGHWRKIPDKPCNHKTVNSLTGKLDVCRYHGGIQMQNKRQYKLAREREAKEYLHQMDVEPIGNPLDELEKVVGEARALYEYYRDSAAQMKSDVQRFESEKGIEQIRGEVSLMERALDRYIAGLETLQRLRKQDAGSSAGETLLDLIKSGLDSRE